MGVLDDAHRDGLVVGLSSETDVPIARQDIDVMLLDQPDTFNLMIIALLELMGVETLPWKTPDEDRVTIQDKFSWFQIASTYKQRVCGCNIRSDKHKAFMDFLTNKEVFIFVQIKNDKFQTYA